VRGTPVPLEKSSPANYAPFTRCRVFFFFFTLVTGPRRSLSLKLSDTRVYEPQIRARLGTTAHFCKPCSAAADCKQMIQGVTDTKTDQKFVALLRQVDVKQDTVRPSLPPSLCLGP